MQKAAGVDSGEKGVIIDGPWPTETPVLRGPGRENTRCQGSPRGASAYLVGTLLTLLLIQTVACYFGQDRIQGIILQVQPLQVLEGQVESWVSPSGEVAPGSGRISANPPPTAMPQQA